MLCSRLRVVAVLASLLLAAPALSHAQGQGGGGGGGRAFGGGRGGFGRGGGTGGLLMMEEVQKELGITAEQKTELTKTLESLRPAGGPGVGFDREEFQKLSEEERTKRREEMAKQGEELAKKTDEAVKGLLKPEQWTRLTELRNQREGVRALSRPEIQKELSLSEEQIAKIKTLNAAQAQGFNGRGNFRDLSEADRAKAVEEMNARREAYEKGVAEVLTPDQQTAWAKLQGAKFEFPQRGQGGGQGGGRRRPE